jgi:hypothetical protein
MTSPPLTFSDATQAFVAHWKSVRQADLVPQSSRFLDCADPRFQPYLSFNDIAPSGENVVSLVGTALVTIMNRDWTGLTTASFLPPQSAENVRQDFSLCATHPCGMWEISSFFTSASRSVSVEVATLPLKMGSSSRLRVVRFHRLIEVLHHAEFISEDMRFKSKQWLDLDAGVPARAPLPSAMPPK